MKKGYVLRHQVLGRVTTHVFLSPPTGDEIAEALKGAPQAIDESGNPCEAWFRVEEVRVFGDTTTADDFVEPEPELPGRADVLELVISGTGTVTPPEV